MFYRNNPSRVPDLFRINPYYDFIECSCIVISPGFHLMRTENHKNTSHGCWRIEIDCNEEMNTVATSCSARITMIWYTKSKEHGNLANGAYLLRGITYKISCSLVFYAYLDYSSHTRNLFARIMPLGNGASSYWLKMSQNHSKIVQ
jgi:hypothetical protein